MKKSNKKIASTTTNKQALNSSVHLQQLQICSINFQHIWKDNLIEIKFGETSKFTVSSQVVNKESYDYAWAIERPWRINSRLIESSLCSPFCSYILFNYVTIYITFAFTCFLLIRMTESFRYNLQYMFLIICFCSIINSVIFFISALYLFVVWIQENCYIKKLGRTFKCRLAYYGVMFGFFAGRQNQKNLY